MDKFKNKYRIPSARLQSWDYGWNGSYFITICTKNREYFFGKIKNGKMELSEIGKITEKYWHEIPQHFSFVKLGAFVVMPNHIHGIIIIDKKSDDNNPIVSETVVVETPKLGVSTITTPVPTEPKTGGKNQKWKSGTLGAIINQYKRICTINSRKIEPYFAWQPRFYDHIIRNEKSFQKISEYIINNPKNWINDKFINQINQG
ncbi:MAG: hypothetical protein J7L46_07865 [Bacteroidales bacterium]|nr:hypothetical protein [Bacteroidales bacterium]